MPGFSKSPAVRALHDAGISVERLTHLLGCSQHEMSTALQASHRAVPHLHATIAALVNRPLCELWPRFYDDGAGLRAGVIVLARPVRATPWQAGALSHDQIAQRLMACGQGGAIRLLPVEMTTMRPAQIAMRLRSLPPLIALRAA